MEVEINETAHCTELLTGYKLAVVNECVYVSINLYTGHTCIIHHT